MRRLQYLLLSALLAPVAAGFAPAQVPATSHPEESAPAAQSARDTYAAPMFQATTRNVVLDAVVLDAKGHPVTGLTRNDFAIREDGALQELRSFDAVRAGAGSTEASPRTILLVDEMNTHFEDMAYTRYSVARLLKQSSREELRGGAVGGALDQPTALYVLSNDGLHVLQDYTRDPAAIDHALRSHKAVLPWRLHRGFHGALERVNLSLTALDQVAIANAGVPGHKNIVWISPGFPIFSALQVGANGQKQLFDAIRQLSDRMLKARISIYSVDPRGVEGIASNNMLTNNLTFAAYLDAASSADEVAFGDLAIQTLAVQTGGHAFYGRNDVDREIASSIANGNTYYTLAYSPSNRDFHGEFRKVKISVIDRPDLKVQTRDGYYAFPEGQALPEKDQLRELASSLSAPLQFTGVPIPVSFSDIERSPIDGSLQEISVRFRVPSTALSWTPDAQGHMHSTVTIAAADQAKDGHWRERVAHTDLITLAAGVMPSAQDEAALSFRMPYHDSKHVRFVVRDDTSGRIGSSEVTLN